jgi:tryptophan synthase alpha chain
MELESYLRGRLEAKGILLMTHIVVGYPSFSDCSRIVADMVEAGVDLMELQIPFSEPIADGPTILHANQKALAGKARVQECLDFAAQVTRRHDIPFVAMTYYNIIFRHGVDRFVDALASRNLQGAIVPDLPPEEGKEYLEAMAQRNLAPVLIFSPTSSQERLNYLASQAKGFIYCVARKGVTGAHTAFSLDLETYLGRCRRATHLPLAVGFGIKSKRDIDFLRGKADIAVIGTETIRLMEREGVEAVGDFLRTLR